MIVAGAYTYITVNALVISYNQPVRSVLYTYQKKYDPPAVVIYPEDKDEFIFCDYEIKKYNGDKDMPIYTPNNCSMHEYLYFSHIHNALRKALVFKGPTYVELGEKNHFVFRLNLTNRTISKLEYRIYNTFDSFNDEINSKNQQKVFGNIEMNYPMNVFAGDFVNFVKLDKTIDKTLYHGDYINFEVTLNLARMIPRFEDETSDDLHAFIEWGDPILEESQEIVSTNVWNTLGSLCAMFLALGKVWLYGKYWIQKVWRTYKRHGKNKRRYTEHQEFLKSTLPEESGDEKSKDEL